MEQKEETKFFDFTQVEMEVSFDEKMKVDISLSILKMPQSLMAAGGKRALIEMFNQ